MAVVRTLLTLFCWWSLNAEDGGGILPCEAAEYYVAFPPNYDGPTYLPLFISTREVEPVPFSIDTLSGYHYTGVTNIDSSTIVELPTSLIVTSSAQRDKGIKISAGDKQITVYGLSYRRYTADAFAALPCSREDVDEYEYYGAMYDNGPYGFSQFLMVACEDNTEIRVGSTVITLNEMETYLYTTNSDLTGTRVVSNKPISFFAGHQCNNIPTGVAACDHILEQLPNTALWGKYFLIASLHGRSSDDIYSVISPTPSTTVTFACNNRPLITRSQFTNNHEIIVLSNNAFCAIESNKPVLVVQYSPGHNADRIIGDPSMITLFPIEQYSNDYAIFVPSGFSTNAIAIFVPPEFYQPENIFFDETSQINAGWTSIACANQTTCGYAAYINVGTGEHSVYHGSTGARFGVSVYGFNPSISYGYPAVGAVSGGTTCSHSNLRLTGGTNQQGTVEICINNNWGTICDNGWSTIDANIACRQLGYSNADATARSNAYFGQGSGSISLTNVGCTGSESRLINCSYSTSSSGCSSSDAAGVECQTNCTHGSVRIVDGSNSLDGRVEVCLNGLWGTVCDNSWSHIDANIICWQLGYSNADSTAYSSAYFGQGIIPILISNVSCSGSESSLVDCSYSRSTSNCGHNEDAGVRCQYRCTHGSVRVVDGLNNLEGRVEVCLNGAWGTVCDDSWSQEDANVVCRQLGHSNSDATPFDNAHFGEGVVPIKLDDVACSGSESQLLTCSYDSNTADCSHHEDAGVRCQEACTHGSIRLRGGSMTYEGRVEVCVNGVWGSVCDDLWGVNDAKVACRKVGYPLPNPVVYTNAAFGQASLPILLDDVQCSGSEATLTSCVYDSNTADCIHAEDAGVKCQHVPTSLTIGTALTSSVGGGSINYYQYYFPSNGITIKLNVGTGTINCYVSDRFQNPNEELYDWKIVVSGYADTFIDPNLLGRTPGSNIYIGLQGVASSNTFTLDSTSGDTRVPLTLSSDSGVSDTLGAGERTYYEIDFVSNGVTIRLFVTRGTIICYASDLIQNPNDEQGYVWRVTAAGYIDVFLDPDSLSRTAGSSLYIGLEGVDMINNYTLNSTTGDRRVPESYDVDEEILGSLQFNELNYFKLEFPSNGITFTLTVNVGYITCYASDTVQNPNEEQGYEWKVVTNGTVEVYLDPNSLGREAGFYIYTGLEGGSTVNNFSLNSTAGDRRTPTTVVTNTTVTDTIGEKELIYYQFNFPSRGVTITLNITSGSVICYASDRYRNPNEAQGYDWRIEVSSYADIFLDPALLSRSPGATVFVGIRGKDTSNHFTLGNTEGDRRVPTVAAIGEGVRGSVALGERLFFRIVFPSNGLTIRLSAQAGRVVCYASDRLTNPTGTQGYDWKVETDDYTDVFIDPILLRRASGEYIYIAIEGLDNTNNFSLNSTQGDHRVPFDAVVGSTITSSLVYREVIYYRFSFPTNGLTLVLDIDYGSVVCYASDSLQNPNRQHGYSFRVEASYYNDSYIDPSMAQGAVGGYIFIAIEGSSNISNNTFSLNGTAGDSATKVPDPPHGLQSLLISATSATIAWEAPAPYVITPISDIEYYELMVYENQHNLSTIFANTTSLQYVFTGLEEFVNYTCEIAAVNRVGQGQFSSALNFQTLQAAPSGPPQNFIGSAISTTLIKLQWELPAAIDINGIITKYVVNIVEVYSGQSYSLFTENMHVNVGPLHPYYTYECSIAAFTIETGVFSSPINVTTLETVPSGPPRNLSDEEIGSRTVLLSWKPPQFELQNGRIREYTIRVTHNRTGLMYTITSSSNQHLLQNLFPFHTYIFEVAAQTVGLGPYSPRLVVTLLEEGPHAPPESVSVYAINATSIFLGWEPPPNDTHNGIIRGYQINCTEVDTGISFSVMSQITELILADLHPAYMYSCKVSAVTVESGVFSGNVTITTEEAAPSGPPIHLTADIVLSRSIELSWSPPLPENRNGNITMYTITVINADTGETNELSTTDTSFKVVDLKPYMKYHFSVAASTAAGIGPSTQNLSLTTAEDLPYEPQLPRAQQILDSPTELLVSWNPPLEPNGIITSYNVYCYEVDDDESGSPSNTTIDSTNIDSDITVVVTGTVTETVVPGLTPYTYYDCYVTANTSIGEGVVSKGARARTDEYIPATPPDNATIEDVDANTLRISWLEPLVPYGVITSYMVQYNISTGNLTTFTTYLQHALLEGLNEFTIYAVRVSASTRVGFGPYSLVYGRTGQAKPHSSPISVLIPSTAERGATISWQPPIPEDRNGIITYYLIVIHNLQFSIDDITANVPGSDLSYSVSGLEEYCRYECQVAAGTIIGSGPFSSRVEFLTMEDAPSAPPQNLMGSTQSDTIIDLTWSAPPVIDTNGVLQHYSIRVLESETGRSWSFVHIEPEISVGSLHPYYNYECSVAAYTVGLGPYSNTTIIQTAEAVPTFAPLGLRINATGSHSVVLTWEQPPLEHRNGRIRRYQVRLVEIESGDILQLVSQSAQVNVSNLHPFYNYNCSVAAETIAIGPFSDYILAQTEEYGPSDVPRDFAGEVVDSTTVALTWNPPPQESQNGIIRKYIISATEMDTGVEYSWESVSTGIEIHSLHPFYTYQFTVAAYTVQQGPSSYIVTLKTPEDIPSAVPQNVTIELVLSRSFTISWQPPADEDQNGLITHYTVLTTDLATDDTTVLNTTDTISIVSDLIPFTTYEVTVAAHTSAGRGPFSVTQTVQTLEAAPNTPPRDLEVSIVGTTSLHLSWSAPYEEDWNGVIREYHVNITEINSVQAQLLTYTTTNLFITVQSLHPFYTYECQVSAFTVATGPFTNVSEVTLPEAVPSGYPQNFQILPTSSRSIELQWEPPLIESKNGIITEYTIRQVTGDQDEYYATNAPHFELTDLIPHTGYTFTIAASTSVGTGPYSPIVNVITPEDVPTGPPRHLAGIPTSSQSIYLTWLPPNVDMRNGIIREYYVNLSDLVTGDMQQFTSRSQDITITNLHPYYRYNVSVSAYTVALGPFSQQLTLLTLEDVPSGAPLNVIADASDSRTISIHWDPPPLQQQNGIIIGYIVSIIPIIGGGRTDYETANHSLVVEGLTPHTSYECIIAAMTRIGSGPSSAIVTVRTLEEAPSGRPSNSSGVSLNATHIYLTWDPPPLNQTHGNIQEYQITITEYESDLVTFYTSNTTELVVGPLHPYYTYNCSIQAVTVEPGPPINIIVRTQEAAPSSPPSSFAVMVINATAIFLSWEPPPAEYQNGIIRQYVVELHTNDFADNITVSATESNVTITSLHPYTLYECTVAAQTILVGVSSSIQLARTQEAAPSASPEQVLVLAVSPTAVQIEWLPLREEDRNGVIRTYTVNITEVNTGSTWQLTVENDTDALLESLHPFYTYHLSVAAETIALGPYSVPTIFEMPEDAPSSPPTSVTVGEVTSTSLTLSWNHPQAMDWNGIIRNFAVNLTDENTGQQQILTTTANTLQIANVHPFYIYLCSVSAVTISAGPYSPPISVTTLSSAPTGPPQNIIASEVDASSITLMWDPPVAPEQNGIITNYVINMTSEDGNQYSFRTSANSYTIPNLEPFKVYYFMLAAETLSGQGPFSLSIPFRTGESDPTSSPGDLIVASIGSSYAEVRWSPPDSSGHNGIIRFYTVFIVEEETTNNFTLTSTTTRLIATDLHPFYTYIVTVAAVTVLPGPFSQPLQFQTLQDVPSASPGGFEGTPLNSTKLLLTWQPPPENQLNGVLTGYVVNVTETETGNQYQISTDVAEFIFQDLHPFYRYTFISAAVTVGQGPFSDIFSLQMPEDAPTAPPATVQVNVFNSSALSVNWRPPFINQQNGIIVGYSVHLLELATDSVYIFEVGGTLTELFITSLHPYYVYELTVAAKTVYIGPFSPPTSVQMDEDAPSGSPINVSAIPLDSTSIELVWQPPPPQSQNGIIRHYSIDYYISETRQNVFKQITGNSTSTVVTDLHPYYTYSFQVAAVTISSGPQSAAATARTLEREPTGVPQSVEAVAVSSTSIRLTWEPPVAEEQNGVIRSYHINVSAFEDKEMMNYEADGLSTLFILNSLHPYYLYRITIAAFTVGVGPPITVHGRTHQEIPTGAPENLTVTALNSSTVQVTWDPPLPHTQNGPITEYVLLIAGIDSDEEYELHSGSGLNVLDVASLHPFYTYTYTIAAVGIGAGPYSPALSFQMPDEVCRETVRNVSVTVTSASSVRVMWFPPGIQFWNGVISSYTVVYELTKSVDAEDDIEPVYSQSHTVPGMLFVNNPDPRVATLPLKQENVVIEQLEEFYVYQFTVFLENAVGQSDVSNRMTVDMPPAAPSGPPTSVIAIALSSTSILITWHNPMDFDFNGILTGFYIGLTDARGNERNYTQPASTYSLHIEGLEKFAVYTIEVSARNDEGEGPMSEPVTIRTQEDVPSAPVDGSVEMVNSTAVQVKWSPPISLNGHLLYYTITYYEHKASESDSDMVKKSKSVLVTETTTIVTNLQPGLTYSFEIRANTSVGFGEGITVTFTLVEGVVSQTGNDDQKTTAAIAVCAVVAGMAIIVIVVLVTVLLWRYIQKNKRYGFYFGNRVNKSEDKTDTNLHLMSYTTSNEQKEQSTILTNEMVEDGSELNTDCKEPSTMKADTNM